MSIPERPSQVKFRLSYFLPINIFRMVFPIFRSTPAFDVGKPVDLAICCLTFVIPNARFQEKLKPGIGVDFLFMILTFFYKFNSGIPSSFLIDRENEPEAITINRIST